VRIGLVGAGWAAAQHAASLAALGEAPPVVVTDPDAARAERLARDCGAQVAPDLGALLGHGLDAAVVSTPTGAHAAAILPLLAAGVAVFVEKPLSVTPEDAAAVVAAAAASGLPVAVGYQWRAVPALEALRRELAGQRVALLATLGIGITQARPWFTDGALSSGLLGERGSHHLDLLDRLGGPVAEVRAVRGGVRVSGAAPVGSADVMTVSCTYTSGAVSTTALVWASPEHAAEQSLRVVSDGGHYLLALDPDFRLTGRSGHRDVLVDSAEVPFVRQLARFLAAVRAGTPDDVFCTPEQAARTVAVVSAAARSLDTGAAEPPGYELVSPW
jgi:myo-inositol 2-dehydrogenase/D-chiro-inositol 1-dehydrogenase